jgi:hypothetical protein
MEVLTTIRSLGRYVASLDAHTASLWDIHSMEVLYIQTLSAHPHHGGVSLDATLHATHSMD